MGGKTLSSDNIHSLETIEKKYDDISESDFSKKEFILFILIFKFLNFYLEVNINLLQISQHILNVKIV